MAYRIDLSGRVAFITSASGRQDVAEDDNFVFDTNVKGAFFVAQAVGKRLRARASGSVPGTFRGGRTVNFASVVGLRVLPQIGVYGMGHFVNGAVIAADDGCAA